MKHNDKEVVHKRYRNYKGEVAMRHFIPHSIRFDKYNEWHGNNVWILKAMDVEKNDFRDFSLQDFLD